MSEQSFEAPAGWNPAFVRDFFRVLERVTKGEPYRSPEEGDYVVLCYNDTYSGKTTVEARPLGGTIPESADDGGSFALRGMILTQGQHVGDEITIKFRRGDENATVTFGTHLQDGPFVKLGSWEGDSLFWP